jgi:hypothetical protein
MHIKNTIRFCRSFAAVFGATCLFTFSKSEAQSYAGKVLYPLSAPPGFAYVGAPGGPHAAAGGQTVSDGQGAGYQAVLWTTPTGKPINLNPNQLFPQSFAFATSGTQQVGEGFRQFNDELEHALLWSGSAASAIDLNPTNLTGFTSSVAQGIGGNQQVGFGYRQAPVSSTHALLWSGTANSAVDLNPTNLSGFVVSQAYGTDGSRQVGQGSGSSTGNQYHALLWSGTAASAVDLQPTDLTGFTSSTAQGIKGAQQVGSASGPAAGNGFHPMLWFGTAGSAIDLQPTNLPGLLYSDAMDTNGLQQAGYALLSGTGGYRALVWSGTADSAVNLQNSLPLTGSWEQSLAFSIDTAGNTFGMATGTFNGIYNNYAIEWSPVPEPSSVLLLAIGTPVLLRRRRK